MTNLMTKALIIINANFCKSLFSFALPKNSISTTAKTSFYFSYGDKFREQSITSNANEKVKFMKSLNTSKRKRGDINYIFLEGHRLVIEAMEAGIHVFSFLKNFLCLTTHQAFFLNTYL